MSTTLEKIDVEEARLLLAKAMVTQGRDFVYNPNGKGGCFNVPKTHLGWSADDPRRTTGCLVGTAMALSGRIEDMSYYEEGPVWSTFSPYLTRSAAEYLTIAQNTQDHGGTWGEAFDKAEESVDVLGQGVVEMDDTTMGGEEQ